MSDEILPRNLLDGFRGKSIEEAMEEERMEFEIELEFEEME